MDKEFAEVFQEEIVVEGKIEELGKQIAGLAHKFKEGKDDVMTMADEMITNGSMPDPEMIKMLETEEADMVIHLIAKKMGVQWTKDNGYGEMRFKQNYPESTDMVMNLLGKKKDKIEEAKEREISHDEYLKHGAGKGGKQWSTGAGKNKKYWTHRKEEIEIDEMKSSSGYELYHKDFSSAMQHAYAFAKKKGNTIDPKEIDDKVAVGPKKPSKGKVNRYALKAGKKLAHIQVANLDDKRYELNMYFDKEYKGKFEEVEEGIDIQKADMKDVIKDFQSSDAPQFKGKSDKKRKEMAIAAKLSREENEDDDPVGKKKKKLNKDVINLKPTAESSMKKLKDIMTKLKEKRFNDVKETTNLKKEKVEVEESDGYEVDLAAKKIQHKWKRMSKQEKVRFLDKMDVLAGKTKVSDSDLEDILGDYGLYMEASGGKEAYQKFFNGVLKKFGVKSPSQLKGDKKKEFFDYIDKNWTADHEEETKKEETMTKKSLKDVVSNMKEKKLKVQEAITIGGVEVGEQEFDKQFRLDNVAPNLGMTYADYQAKFKTDGLEGPYQIDGGAYFWDKAATKWFSVETEDYVDDKRNAELNFRYTKQGTAGGGLMHNRRL